MPVAILEPPKPKTRKSLINTTPAIMDELVAFCPKCMTLETLFFTDEGMMPTRRFSVVGNKVYHNCGSVRPCRLYRVF